MENIRSYIDAFSELGGFLTQFITAKNTAQYSSNTLHNLYFNKLDKQLKLAQQNNAWFTQENLLFTLKYWSKALNKKNLTNWLKNQNLQTSKSKKIALITAGNIPIVGFHDFISILISGHIVLIKQSSKDMQLLPLLAKYLQAVLPEFKHKILFAENKLSNFDAVIATGSNNTARYFEYYFKNKPSIIRKNKNSVAVIKGDESQQDLMSLSEDIFRYFGLGCRSVSKLYVPENYNFNNIFNAVYHKHKIIENCKYANNYDYNKAVYLMSEFNFLDNGFLMIKEDKAYCSPIATVFYEHYKTLDQLRTRINRDSDKIQCVVASNFDQNDIAFGKAQLPDLHDYADGVNTLEFLANL
ncbi:MAG: acyl-CoA reductase [Tenacibaculum sp.]